MFFFTDRFALTTRLLLVLCLAASCAAPPPVQQEEAPPASDATALAPQQAWTLRVGVEYLPPGTTHGLRRGGEDDLPTAEPTSLSRRSGHERLVGEGLRPLPRLPEDRERKRLHGDVFWDLDEAKLRRIKDPVERMTVRLIHDLMGEDRRRIKRELGTPILTNRHEDLQMPYHPSHFDEQDSEEEAEFLAHEARRLLRRPLRNALKKTALVESIEVALDEFKAKNLPTSGAYQDSHPDKVKWGRVSMRVRVHDGSDPVEMRYILNGWRIAASKEKLKAGYQTWLADGLSFEVRTRYDLEMTDWNVRADLVYYLNDSTRFHCVAGDNLDFLATSNLYSLFDSPMDGAPGVLFYAVHLF